MRHVHLTHTAIFTLILLPSCSLLIDSNPDGVITDTVGGHSGKGASGYAGVSTTGGTGARAGSVGGTGTSSPATTASAGAGGVDISGSSTISDGGVATSTVGTSGSGTVTAAYGGATSDTTATPTAGGAPLAGGTAGAAPVVTTGSGGRSSSATTAGTAGDAAIGGTAGRPAVTTGGIAPTGGASTAGRTGAGGATGGSSTGALSVAPTSLDFGAILVSGQSSVRNLTVTNTGGIATSAIATSLPAGPFTLASDTCKNVDLAPNATCTIGVTFNPTSATNTPQTSTFAVSATTGGALTIGLSGSAVALSLDQSSFTFPTTSIYANSSARSFTVTNPSTITAGSATGLAVAFTGAAPGDYHLDSSTCTGSLGANGICTVVVSFRPLSFGARTATMTIGATPGGSASATLTGQGQAADGQQGCASNNDCQSGACVTYYQDTDEDTYGNPNKPLNVCGYSVPSSYVVNADDCNDSNAKSNHNSTICRTSTQREYCLDDAVVQYQDCTGGCMDGACVGTVSIAGTFTCDATVQCTTAQGCSWTGTPASPGTAPACNLDNSTENTVACDDSSDCGTGQVCCRNSNCGLTRRTTCFSGTTCPSSAMCSTWYQVCNPLSPVCPTGTTCKRYNYSLTTGQGSWDCE